MGLRTTLQKIALSTAVLGGSTAISNEVKANDTKPDSLSTPLLLASSSEGSSRHKIINSEFEDVILYGAAALIAIGLCKVVFNFEDWLDAWDAYFSPYQPNDE